MSLTLGLYLFFFSYGITLIGALSKESFPNHPFIFGAMFGGIGLVLPVISVIRGRFMAVLTDRRLLLLASPIARRPTDLALHDVHHVHGLAKGCHLPVQVETSDGGFVSFNGDLWERNLGLAIADATGLPAADHQASRVERNAGLFYWADWWGRLMGFAVFATAAIGIVVAIKPVLDSLSAPTKLGIALATMMILMLVGTFAGRVLGTVLAALWLRRSDPTNNLRDAVDLLAHRRIVPREKDEFRRLQPLVWHMAGIADEPRSDPKPLARRGNRT